MKVLLRDRSWLLNPELLASGLLVFDVDASGVVIYRVVFCSMMSF